MIRKAFVSWLLRPALISHKAQLTVKFNQLNATYAEVQKFYPRLKKLEAKIKGLEDYIIDKRQQ